MALSTFSGPVASQNGFVAPTFTSTTLPYFVQGNIVYVSDLNTLAFGGADQWYRQDTGAGLGTGGNVTPPGPVATTYTSGVNYGSASFGGMGTSGYLGTSTMDSAMTAAFAALPVGGTIVATFGTPTSTANLTVTATPTNTGPGAGDWSVAVTSNVSLMGTVFDTLTF